MPTELLIVLAALLLAMQRTRPSAPPSQAPPPSTHDDLRFQVTYFQQFVSVQAAQTGATEAKCAVLLTLDALLIQYVATPLVNTAGYWLIFGLFGIVAVSLLGVIVMQRVEVMSSKDPLMARDPATLDEDTLRKTHRTLHAMLVDNERRLTTRENVIRAVLTIGLIATGLGLIFNHAHPPQPQPVIIVTPSPPPTAASGQGPTTPMPVPPPPTAASGQGPTTPTPKPRPTPTKVGKQALQHRVPGVVSSSGRPKQ